jgi:hypothetical protein
MSAVGVQLEEWVLYRRGTSEVHPTFSTQCHWTPSCLQLSLPISQIPREMYHSCVHPTAPGAAVPSLLPSSTLPSFCLPSLLTSWVLPAFPSPHLRDRVVQSRRRRRRLLGVQAPQGVPQGGEGLRVAVQLL